MAWNASDEGKQFMTLSNQRWCAADLADHAAVLEVAPGPGYLAIELARQGPYHITGLDSSRSLVRIARRAERAGVAIDFQHGDVARMPFSDATFDRVVC